MKNKIRAVYLDVERAQPPVEIEIEEKLKTFYDLIRCDTIDIVRRNIGGKEFSIVVDDEGLLKPNVISATCIHRFVKLVGNLVICGNVGNDGKLLSLTSSDVELIKKNCYLGRSMEHPNGYWVLRIRN